MNELIRPGTIVGVWIGIIQHVGILTESGTVIANSFVHGGVIELPVPRFTIGKRLSLKGYPGRLPPQEVVTNARAEMGQPWNLFKNNCEHFVRRVHGLRPHSPQLQRAMFALGLTAVSLLLHR